MKNRPPFWISLQWMLWRLVLPYCNIFFIIQLGLFLLGSINLQTLSSLLPQTHTHKGLHTLKTSLKLFSLLLQYCFAIAIQTSGQAECIVVERATWTKKRTKNLQSVFVPDTQQIERKKNIRIWKTVLLKRTISRRKRKAKEKEIRVNLFRGLSRVINSSLLHDLILY